MYAHQRATLDAIAQHFRADEDVIALLLGGSITKGWAREDSDVDIMIVIKPEAYQAHLQRQELTYFNDEVATYEGGYVDGKFIDKQFLLDVFDHGSEVAKSAFMGVEIVFSHDPEIVGLIEQICQYPEDERAEKIRSFVSQVMLWRWFVGEAVKREDRYLLLQAVTELVLFGSRLILTHNRLLFPYHKWMRRQLQACEELPDGYFALMDDVLENPGVESANAYADLVLNFQDWSMSVGEAVVLFLHDREWNWREHKPPIHDW